jgi:hypothetical protein
MKPWFKIREETYPIKLLAEHKRYSDECKFHLMPIGYPNIDAKISADGEEFELQITIADPGWVARGRCNRQSDRSKTKSSIPQFKRAILSTRETNTSSKTKNDGRNLEACVKLSVWV